MEKKYFILIMINIFFKGFTGMFIFDTGLPDETDFFLSTLLGFICAAVSPAILITSMILL